MLKLFNTKIALLPFTAIIILLLFMRGSVIYNGVYIDFWGSSLSPFSLLFKTAFQGVLKNLWFHIILSSIIIFYQANIIISIIERLKNSTLCGFLLAWIYILLMHVFPAFVFVSPQLIALSFVLLSFKNLLKVDESRNKLKMIFNVGLLIGVAASFWSPSAIFVLFAIFVLIKTYNLDLRNTLTFFIAFSIPYIYTISYLFLTNKEISIFKPILFNNLNFNFYDINQLVSIIIICVLVLISIGVLFGFLSKQLRKTKEFFIYVFFFVFCVMVLFFIQNENNVNVLLYLMFPTSVLLTVLFNTIKRKFIAETLHLMLFLSIVVNFIYFIK